MVFIASQAIADDIYVAPDVSLSKREASKPFVITQKMKDDLVAYRNANPSNITVKGVKSIIQGSTHEAIQVIKWALDNGFLKTFEQRYNELYPSVGE